MGFSNSQYLQEDHMDRLDSPTPSSDLQYWSAHPSPNTTSVFPADDIATLETAEINELIVNQNLNPEVLNNVPQLLTCNATSSALNEQFPNKRKLEDMISQDSSTNIDSISSNEPIPKRNKPHDATQVNKSTDRGSTPISIHGMFAI
jgi:hypothetical protein